MSLDSLKTIISQDINRPLATFGSIIESKIKYACKLIHKRYDFYYSREHVNVVWLDSETEKSFSDLVTDRVVLSVFSIQDAGTGGIAKLVNYDKFIEATKKQQDSTGIVDAPQIAGPLSYFFYYVGPKLVVFPGLDESTSFNMVVKMELDDADIGTDYLSTYFTELVLAYAKYEMAKYLKDAELIKIYGDALAVEAENAKFIDDNLRANFLTTF